MNVKLDWPEELVQRLAQEANRQGLSLDDYVLKSVLRVPGRNSGGDDELRTREEAGNRIRELRKGNVLGPDLTIRDLVEEGRRT